MNAYLAPMAAIAFPLWSVEIVFSPFVELAISSTLSCIGSLLSGYDYCLLIVGYWFTSLVWPNMGHAQKRVTYDL